MTNVKELRQQSRRLAREIASLAIRSDEVGVTDNRIRPKMAALKLINAQLVELVGTSDYGVADE